MDDLMMYGIIIAAAVVFFVAILKKVLDHIDTNGFAKRPNHDTSDTSAPSDTNRAMTPNALLNGKSVGENDDKFDTRKAFDARKYDEFCEYINTKLSEHKALASEQDKPRYADLAKELAMVQGQNSDETKLQRNLFRFLRELEECVSDTLGANTAAQLKSSLGDKYNELFN